MKRTLWIAATGLALVTLGAGAMAQRGAAMGEPQTRADVAARAKARFAVIDANRDGKATKEEFAAARDARREEMRGKAFERIDADKDGKISRSEFDAGGAKMRERRGEFRKRRAEMAGRGEGRGPGKGGLFARADTDSNGSVSEAELLASVMARFDASDTNKDGTVTREERRAAIQTHGRDLGRR